jgi:predicted glycosyltransferase
VLVAQLELVVAQHQGCQEQKLRLPRLAHQEVVAALKNQALVAMGAMVAALELRVQKPRLAQESAQVQMLASQMLAAPGC